MVELCELLIRENLGLSWTCNSRVDYVDEEMLTLMGKSGCWMISWGLESGNEAILKAARKGADPAKAARALRWAKNAGIKNWGYFIIGLPGEAVEIRQGKVIVYNKEHSDGFILDESAYLGKDVLTRDTPRIEVAADEYFVMGDNRMFSYDSRAFGPIKKNKIVGRVLLRALLAKLH